MSSPTPPVKRGPNPHFVRFAHFLLRSRFKVLFIALACTAWMGFQVVTSLRVDNSVEAFTETSGEPHRVLTELRHHFGRDDVFLIIVEGDVFTPAYLKRLKDFTDELWTVYPELLEDPYLRETENLHGPQAVSLEAPPPDDAFEDEFEGDESFDSDEGTRGEAPTAPPRTIFEEITSLINVRRARPSGGGVGFPMLMDPLPEASALAQLKEEVLGDRFLVENLVSAEGDYSLITLRTPAMKQFNTEIIYEELLKIAKSHRRDDFDVYVSGIPALTVELNRLMFGDLKRMLALATLGMILILFFLFRHPIGVMAPLIVVAMSAIWTFGAMALAGVPMTLLSSILPAFLTCVGVGDSIHLMSVYRDRRKAGDSNHDAIAYGLGSVGMPIIYTSLTTMTGLLSFQLSSLNAIGEMGAAGGFGVLMAMVFSLTLLPIALSFNTRGTFGLRTKTRRDLADRFLDLCNSASRPTAGPARHRRRHIALLFMVALLGVSVLGMSKLTVSHDPVAWVPDDNRVVKSLDIIEAHFGGSSNVELLVTPPPGKKVSDLELLKALDSLDAHIKGYVHGDGSRVVGTSFSLVDLVKETHRAFNGLKSEADRLPDDPGVAAELLDQVIGGNRDAVRKVVTTGLDRTRITFRVKWMDATSYFPLTVHIEEGIRTFIGDKAQIQKTGGLYTVFTIVGNLVFDLIKSFLLAFSVITVLMVFFLGSVRIGLIAMIPNLLPIAFIMGVMGFGGIPIDLNNLLIASIAMGLAVDDTIHFLHHFKEYFDATENVEEAVEHALKYCGRAILVTSLILAVGFYAYLGADMINVQRFGLLVGTTVVAALLIDLVFCPALLRTFFRPTNRPPALPLDPPTPAS